jgi:hypothetical protein
MGTYNFNHIKLISFDCVEIAAQVRVFQLVDKERFEAKLKRRMDLVASKAFVLVLICSCFY